MTKPTSIAGAASPRTKAGRDLADFLNTETGGGDYSQSILAIEAEASQRQEALEKALREAADLDQALAEDFHEAYVAWVERYEALLDPQPVEP